MSTNRDRFPRVPAQCTEAQLASVAALLTATDAGAVINVTDGTNPGLRTWNGTTFRGSQELTTLTTAGAAPAASEFLDGELILQLADRKLLAKDASNVVFEVGQDNQVFTEIQGLIYDSSLSSLPPSGAQSFEFGTPTNGNIVALDSGSGNESGYSGLWVYNTSGPWTRLSTWDLGTEKPQGVLLLLPTPEFNYIFTASSNQNGLDPAKSFRITDSLNLVIIPSLVIAKAQFPSFIESDAPNVAQSLWYQTLGTARTRTSGSSRTDEIILGTAVNMFQAYTDCIAATNGQDFAYTVSGTGAAFSSLAVGAENAVGILRFGSGTVATNRGSIASPNFSIIRLGLGLAQFLARHRLPVLSDGTNTYTTRIGFFDSITAESTDGVFFRYTHSVNSGRWQAVTRNNNVETAVDAGVSFGTPTANVWRRFSIEVDPLGTQAKFYIDEMLVATITTNIPAAAGRELGYGIYTQRNVGTAAVNMGDTDYITVRQVFTNRR